MNKEPVKGEKTYTAGTLTYTKSTMLLAMALVLLGVFTYSLAVAFVPKIIPLRLKDLGCSNTLLVFIMSTMAALCFC